MLLSAEERVAYWGHRYMNISCRDINDDEEPDLVGLERILYSIGFLAVTELKGISAWDEDTPSEEEEETEYEAVDSELNPFDYEAADEDAITPTYPVMEEDQFAEVFGEDIASPDEDIPEFEDNPPEEDEQPDNIVVLEMAVLKPAA